MTTLTFLGSRVSYELTRVKTTVDHSRTVKYRGHTYEPMQPLEASVNRGLKFRGVAY